MAQLTDIHAARMNGQALPFQSAMAFHSYHTFQQQGTTRNAPSSRTFRPVGNRRYGLPSSDFPPSRLVRYSPKYHYSRLMNFPRSGARFQPRMNTIVIQVQGISRFNDIANPDSAAAVGVFFGPQCARNSFYPLPIQFKQTANRAVLEGIRCALEHVMMMRHTEFWPGWKEVIIMTDSEYAKNSLSRWVWGWEKNDWNRSGTKVIIENLEAMQNLHNLLTYIEGNLDMSVRFWKVRRGDIAGADGLAQMALGGPVGI